MANICNTTYKVYGSERAINDLFNKLEIYGSNDIPLSDLAREYNINTDEKNISVRGYIYYYELCDDNSILIETETTWTACNELFDEINRILDNELIIDYREIEVGCQVFNVKNTKGYFSEKCCVSASGEPFEDISEDVFSTVYDAILYWCEKMQYDDKDKSEEEMLEIIEDYEYQNEDTYFNIYEFDFLNE